MVQEIFPHTNEYAATGHKHHDEYTLTGHDHNYSDVNHDHEGSYLSAGHTHPNEWITITNFLNGATAYSIGYDAAWTPQYCKRKGIVYLKGLITTNATTTPIIVANLPAGFRARNTHMQIVRTANGFRRMDIESNGNIIFREAPAYTTSWHSITTAFPADN